ncbi:methyltransferase domain-containing protein [Candidatus Chloroploca sp. M-50]|uniref:Methyltransferase domain-containing protein n=1 Tax=Candidatus Chloroploca mongolica TaxID=2528176 RepID=A0ABS4D7X7_9CHLR|nr:methyltransferase domain-containing protein [Candidatus Chloroploca mongolica]MBP1465519.1 methyltransferase domain-containing protein [Candidatus Chloroploca mongolica]
MKLTSCTPSNLARAVMIFADRLHGLDFLTTLRAEEAGLDPHSAFGSSPSGNKYLKHILTDLKITPKDAILDIGCGKGSALRTMLAFPFVRVDGIELSGKIAAIATRNFKRLNAHRVNVFHGDASMFSGYDAYNIVYLYNPFPVSVMRPVVQALTRSVQEVERELVIIYNNPTCHETVVAQGVFAQKGRYPDQWGNGIALYSNRDGRDSRLFGNKRM